MMAMWHVLFFFIYCICVSYATKEDASHSSSQTDVSTRFRALAKRLGRKNGIQMNDLLNVDGTCKTNKITRNSIIMSTESIAAGATYVSSHKEISSVTECSNMCCEDILCDTAIYQENKEQQCYLFACQGFCRFTDHVGYLVTQIQHLKPRSPPPPQEHHEQEDQLENLHNNNNVNKNNNANDVVPQHTAELQDHNAAHTQEEKERVTAAPTPAPKPYVPPHSVGLSGFCTSDISCEDPNAGCFREKCECEQSYYNKAGLCRQVCTSSQFECHKLGLLSRGPECIPRPQVCDSYNHCADGSDEYNCEDPDNPSSEDSNSDTLRKNKDNNLGAVPHSVDGEHEKPEPVNSKLQPTEVKKPGTPSPTTVAPPSTPAPVAHDKTSGPVSNAKFNHTKQATSKPPHHSVGEQVFLSSEKLIIASATSNAEGPIIALSLGLAFTIILIGLLACRLRNMKHRLRKGRPLNSNEADYLINGMYL